MAENIVAGLFGLNPQMFQNQQYGQDLNRGIAMAQLSPGAAAQAGLQASVGQLGRGFAGAMGIEDPQLKMISTRNAIAQQIDQTDPESMLKGAQMLAQAGDQQGAMALAQYARQAQSEMAQAQQRRAAALASTAQATRERQQAVPNDIQIANEIASLTDAQDQLRSQPSSPERDRAMNMVTTRLTELQRLTTKPEKDLRFGTDRESVSAELYDRPFAQLSTAERAIVNKRVEEEQGKKAAAGASKLVLPGEKALVDIPAFTKNVQQTIEKPLNAIYQVDNALANIQDAIKTDNFASYRAAQTQFAKAIAGAGDLSQKELKAAGADPAFIGGTADYLSTLATSTPTKDTMQKMQSAMQTIKKVNTNKANNELERQRKIAISAGYPTEAVNLALSFPELSAKETGGEKKANTRTLKSGKVVTVIED